MATKRDTDPKCDRCGRKLRTGDENERIAFVINAGEVSLFEEITNEEKSLGWMWDGDPQDGNYAQIRQLCDQCGKQARSILAAFMRD